MSKFFRQWQPLVNEDAHTALVFGFLRHAPQQPFLASWLSPVLGESIDDVPALAIDDFWPRYASVVPGHVWTEPELVFEVDCEGRRTLIVVEVKPGFGQHRGSQLAREAIDAARCEGADRVVVVVVGADRGTPADAAEWETGANALLKQHGSDISVRFRYSSWADLAKVIEAGSRECPEWERYAADVRQHLLLKGHLGYEGAPVYDDLENLTITNAVELVNRTIGQAREFFLTLHGLAAFRDLAIEPAKKLVRDGTSDALPGAAEWFELSVIACLYRRPHWAEDRGLMIAFWLGDESPRLQIGPYAGAAPADVKWRFGYAEDIDSTGLANSVLIAAAAGFERAASDGGAFELIYNDREWLPGRTHEDLTFAIDGLRAADRALG